MLHGKNFAKKLLGMGVLMGWIYANVIIGRLDGVSRSVEFHHKNAHVSWDIPG